MWDVITFSVLLCMLVHIIYRLWCRVFQLCRPAKYEQLHAILRKYFNIAEDVTCYALHGDDVCTLILLMLFYFYVICLYFCQLLKLPTDDDLAI